MSNVDGVPDRVIVRRPRNRKAQILEAAAALFQRSGFNQVTMEAIASDVGITVGALYRHFPGKQELLDQVMVHEVITFEAALRPAAQHSIHELCEIVVDRVLETPGGTAMLFRHMHSLSDGAGRVVRSEFRTCTAMLQRALLRERTDCSEVGADAISWAILAVTGSPVLHQVPVRRAAQRDLLLDACRRVCAVAMTAPDQATASAPSPTMNASSSTPVRRREEILEAVYTLSRQHGFANVTMDQIAEQVGIATSSLYNHFDSKLSILGASFLRSAQILELEADQAERRSTDSRMVLTDFAQSYIRVALTQGNTPIYFVTAERSAMPEELRRMQRDYVDRWAMHLSLEPRAGRVVIVAALAVVNYLTQTPHVASQAGFATNLEHMVLAVLEVGLDHSGP